MKKNMGSIDKVVRIIVGAGLLSMVFIGPQTMLGLIGVIPLLTGVMGWCPLYDLLGISTSKGEQPQD